MAWASKKQYAICIESEEGKDLIEDLPNMSQDEFNVEFGKLLGKSGSSYSAKDDEDYGSDEENTPDKILESKRETLDNFNMSKDEGWEESGYGEKSFIKNKDKDNEMFIQYNGEDEYGRPEYTAGYMKDGKYIDKKFNNLEDAKDFVKTDIEKVRENLRTLANDGWERKIDNWDGMFTKLKGTPYEVSMFEDVIHDRPIYNVRSRYSRGDEEYDSFEEAKKIANEYVNKGQAKIDKENNKWNTSKFKKGDYVKVTGGRYGGFGMLQKIDDFLLDDDNEEGGVYQLSDVEGEGSVFNPKYRDREVHLRVLPSSLEIANEDEYEDDPNWVENKRVKHNPRYKMLKSHSAKINNK